MIYTYISCGECGNVVTNSLGIEGEDKETVLFVDESLRVLCTEDFTPGRKEKSSFVVGKPTSVLC